jgi:hypothetical protein
METFVAPARPWNVRVGVCAASVVAQQSNAASPTEIV